MTGQASRKGGDRPAGDARAIGTTAMTHGQADSGRTAPPVARDYGRGAATARLLKMAEGHIVARVVHLAVELGICEGIGETPARAEDLALITHTEPQRLERILRALSVLKIVNRAADGRFENTELGRLLMTSPVQDIVKLHGSNLYWQSLGGAAAAVRDDADPFEGLHGLSFFEWLRARPEDEGRLFTNAMTASVQFVADALVGAYDFARFDQIVDVGGGSGHLLSAILAQAAGARGIVFDKAGASGGARITHPRLTCVRGDFFVDEIPPRADCYILNRVLHDWDDTRAHRILAACRRAMTPGGTLLVIELADAIRGAASEAWMISDILMMLLLGGRERSERELRQLLSSAGLTATRVIETLSPFWIVEATLGNSSGQ